MSKVTGKLTVFFRDPFWVGVFEREEDGQLSACKITFGGEPREQEVYEFLLRRYSTLAYGPPAAAKEQPAAVKNPKRAQREARRQTRPDGIGTRSQQALQLQREQQKEQRQEDAKIRREEEKERRFRLRQEKKKQKHRGR